MPIEDPFEKDPLIEHEHHNSNTKDPGSRRTNTKDPGFFSAHTLSECTVSWRYVLVILLAGCNIFTFADLCLLSASVGPYGSELSSPTLRQSAFLTFYAGYMMSSLPGGRAAETYGGKNVLLSGLLFWSVANVVIGVTYPFSTTGRVGAMISARGLQGLSQGVIFPAAFHLISTWFPERERTGAMAMTLAGLDLGALLGMMLVPTYLATSSTGSASVLGFEGSSASSAIGDSSSMKNAGWLWRAHYYVFAIAGVLLSSATYKLVSSTPEWHPRISLPEVQHITKERPKPIGLLDLTQVATIEWRTLATHPALMAIYGTHAVCGFVWHLTLICLPYLFAERFDIPLKYLVSYLVMPTAASIGVSIVGAAICDALIKAGTPKRAVRTRSVAFGLGVPATGFMMLRVAPNFHSAMAVATMSAACAGLGPKAGWLANILDVAPNHAGLVAGFATMISALPAIIAANITSTQLRVEMVSDLLGGWMVSIVGSILLVGAAAIFNYSCDDKIILK